MLDNQTFIKSGGTGATLQGDWYIGTTGGAAPAAGTLNGPLNGNATSATALAATHKIAGQDFNGTQDVSFNSDAVSEGSTNKYYLSTRAQADAISAISLTSPNSASGGGALSYSRGAFTFTPAVVYSLPTATTSILGGVKIGNNITVDNGVISVAAPFSGSYTDLSNKPSIFSGSYTDLSNKPSIPTNTNQLTNGAGFITSYPSNTLHQVGEWVTGYLGDYLSGTGGGTTSGFSSTLTGGGCCGPNSWAWNVTYEFDQSYFPGYTAFDIDHVSVQWDNYNVIWLSNPGGSFLVTSSRPSVYHSFVDGSGPASGYDKIFVTVGISGPAVYVNSRYSPQDWPYGLRFRFFARG